MSNSSNIESIPATFVYIVAVPVVLGLLKELFSGEIRYWWVVADCYFHRPYDLDQNSKTHDWCYLYNPGNGEWDCVSITARFTLWKHNNGVLVHRYGKDPDSGEYDWKECTSIERVNFPAWKECQKARINPERCPIGLAWHIDRFQS